MIKTVKHIDNDSVIIYSSVFDRYYLKNIKSHLVSSKGHKTADDALDAFESDQVVWVAGIKE